MTHGLRWPVTESGWIMLSSTNRWSSEGFRAQESFRGSLTIYGQDLAMPRWFIVINLVDFLSLGEQWYPQGFRWRSQDLQAVFTATGGQVCRHKASGGGRRGEPRQHRTSTVTRDGSVLPDSGGEERDCKVVGESTVRCEGVGGEWRRRRMAGGGDGWEVSGSGGRCGTGRGFGESPGVWERNERWLRARDGCRGK